MLAEGGPVLLNGGGTSDCGVDLSHPLPRHALVELSLQSHHQLVIGSDLHPLTVDCLVQVSLLLLQALVLLLVLLVLFEQSLVAPVELDHSLVHLHQVGFHCNELLNFCVSCLCDPALTATHQQPHALLELSQSRLNLTSNPTPHYQLPRLHGDYPSQQHVSILPQMIDFPLLLLSLCLPLLR